MKPRLTLAILAGRTASLVSRCIGHGGTVLPGHVVPRIEPTALSYIARQLRGGSVIVSGTNGKTTTTRMVAHVARSAGFHPIHNRSGANLMTGLVSALASNSDLSGHPRGDLGIFEVDEATVPSAATAIAPRILALTNVFRDQLDRYGEVELVAKAWRAAAAGLDPSATLILNADDPTVAQLARDAKARVLTFGFEDRSVGGAYVAHDADRLLCPFCAARLAYAWTAYSHLGHYACPSCGWSRPRPDVAATAASVPSPTNPMGSTLTIEAPGETATLELPLPGLYNAYNALAAAAICTALGIPLDKTAGSIGGSEAVFGRFERIAVESGALVMVLVKNPVGFNQVLRALAGPSPASGSALAQTGQGEKPLMVIAINDLFADGTDVSWLWDVDFEVLAERRYRVLCTGLRAQDMALRLKYAGVPCVDVEPLLSTTIDSALATARRGQEVLVFPTYTAMLDMRHELQRRGHVSPFWED